jgi:mycothiol synthase
MQMPGVDLASDTSVAMARSGELAGYAFVQDTAPHTLLPALAEVHPQQRGKGIGPALCAWIEERARQAIVGLPAGTRSAILQKQSGSDLDARRRLLEQGYRVVRHNFQMAIEMTEPPPEPAVPVGYSIRPFFRDEEGHSLVRALIEAFRDNWGFIERSFEEEYERWMHILDRNPESDAADYWFVAVNGDEIAGFALCRLQMVQEPDSAWIHVVGVRPAWRRRGIALALLRHSFFALYHRGKRRVGLEVDAENSTGATRLYEKAGMSVGNRYDFYEKELMSGES